MPTTPHPITNEQVPLTLGHEFSGTIEEVGQDVHDIKTGARVTVQPIIYDGTCGACKQGYIKCCDYNGFIGLSGWVGGLSKQVVVPRKAVYTIPDSMSMEVAALVEPLAVGWHAVNINPFKDGDSVLILGGRPIGLAVIQALKAKGADRIIVSELAPRQKEFAKQFGANFVIDPTEEVVFKRVKEICDGQGAHVVFDAAGVQPGLNAGLHALRARGTLAGDELTLTRAGERKYMGVATYQAGDFQDVLDAIASGRINPDTMITKKIQMHKVEEEGFKTLINDKDTNVKILVEANLDLPCNRRT
ncbi:MAG: hypothetical protein Q9217_005645 [Psora testacea]